MIYNRNGAVFCYDGVTYRIGDRVYANNQSDFEGLYGVITEIRTESDKETENDTPDIYCCFEAPALPQEIKGIEKRFSQLYQTEKKIEDISLDMVIMAPEMLQVLTVFRSDCTKLKLVHLHEDWANDGDYGQTVDIYMDYHAAKSELNSRLTEEKDNGLVKQWHDRDDFWEECTADQYESWLEGEYCEYHYKLSISYVEVSISECVLGELLRAYMNENRREDFISQVSEWDEIGKLSEEQYQRFIHDPQIPALIQQQLERNERYWESYWDSVSDVAHTLLRQYLACAARPACYTPEKDNPYPLCVGQGREECRTCCLYINMDGEGGIEQ